MSDSKYGLSAGQRRVKAVLWIQGVLSILALLLFGLVQEHLISVFGEGPVIAVGYIVLSLLFMAILCSFQLYRIIFWRK